MLSRLLVTVALQLKRGDGLDEVTILGYNNGTCSLKHGLLTNGEIKV
jgi:hypothetical protein